jgi:hypothetical protein
MAIRPELTLRLPNSPGALAGVCRLLSDERVNIFALGLEPTGQLHLVVDNPVLAAGALRGRHYQVTEQAALFVNASNEPGALASILRLVGDAGVNVNYAYGGAAEGARAAAIVLSVDDAQRASAAAGV